MTCAPESITFDLDDVQGHGTKVSSIAAGAKDGKGIHGIAYDATILALKIAAPDLNTPGTPINEGGLNAAAIAPALRYAVDQGAFAINMSFNGTATGQLAVDQRARSEEHTSELQSLMRISYAVFCLKKKNKKQHKTNCTIKNANTKH